MPGMRTGLHLQAIRYQRNAFSCDKEFQESAGMDLVAFRRARMVFWDEEASTHHHTILHKTTGDTCWAQDMAKGDVMLGVNQWEWMANVDHKGYNWDKVLAETQEVHRRRVPTFWLRETRGSKRVVMSSKKSMVAWIVSCSPLQTLRPFQSRIALEVAGNDRLQSVLNSQQR